MLNRELVLVAIDDATDVERTVELTLSMAEKRGADVHVIDVIARKVTHAGEHLRLRLRDAHDDRSMDVESRLAPILGAAERRGVRVRSVTLQGEPKRVIPAYAQLHQAAMLVVERDYGSSRFWRNGRVVDELARHLPMPMLVLTKRQGREDGTHSLRRILTPVDFSIASALAVRTALDLSQRHGARLTLLHALKEVPPHMVFSGREAWELVRRLPAEFEAVAERLRHKAAFFGAADVDTEVVTGVPDDAILEIARRSGADLIVMGIAHRSWFERLLFGSTLHRVLRRTTLPVLSVPVVAGANRWPNEVAQQHGSRRGWAESAADPVIV